MLRVVVVSEARDLGKFEFELWTENWYPPLLLDFPPASSAPATTGLQNCGMSLIRGFSDC